MWQVEIRHDGLNKYRVIRGNDEHVVLQKAAVQEAAWNAMWQRKLEKEKRVQEKQSKIEEARERSEQASEAIRTIENILKNTLEINDAIDWETLKDNSEFTEPKPQPPKPLVASGEPREAGYRPDLGLLDTFFPSRKRKKIEDAKRLFKNHYDELIKQKEETPKKNAELE